MIFFYYSSRSPTMSLSFALCFFFPPVSSPLLMLITSKHSFPAHLGLSRLSSPCSTQTADPLPPSSPMIHLLPAVFHAVEDSCLNVYMKSYFLFLQAPINFQNELLWHVVKYSRWWSEWERGEKKSDIVTVFWSPSQEADYKEEIKDSISL